MLTLIFIISQIVRHMRSLNSTPLAEPIRQATMPEPIDTRFTFNETARCRESGSWIPPTVPSGTHCPAFGGAKRRTGAHRPQYRPKATRRPAGTRHAGITSDSETVGCSFPPVNLRTIKRCWSPPLSPAAGTSV